MKPTANQASDLDHLLAKPNTVLLDIREEYEYEDDHLDSLHIPMAEVKSRIDELKLYDNIIVCCRSGNRAYAMNHTLNQHLPSKNISYLEGGLDAYRNLHANA
ncbi:MAG: NADH oxidase [Flavobacteriales bacterium]|nr:NADH oxidase [Flavobacteriales bacterium]|tara:strand:+ start:220 stop:528 length:309 start_codon:yes stop_codon:yes gene_type:complete